MTSLHEVWENEIIKIKTGEGSSMQEGKYIERLIVKHDCGQ